MSSPNSKPESPLFHTVSGKRLTSMKSSKSIKSTSSKKLTQPSKHDLLNHDDRSLHTRRSLGSTSVHPYRRPPQVKMTDEEREQFLCTLKSNRGHPLHKEGEDPFYSEEINKRLEAERKKKYVVSVDNWCKERDEMGAEWAEERQRREWAESQKKMEDSKEKKAVLPKPERAHRGSLKKRQERDSKTDSHATSREAKDDLSASTMWRKSRTSEKDWRGMMEASLKKHDFSNFDFSSLPKYEEDLIESFQDSFADEQRAKDLLYTKSAIMTQPVERISKNLRYAAVASSPFNRTLREDYILEEKRFAREQRKKEERKHLRYLMRINKKPRKKKEPKPPPRVPTPEITYDPTQDMEEEDINKYFGVEAKKEFFSIYRTLEAQKNIIPLDENIKDYVAPAFDDSSLYSDINELDGDGSVLLPEHQYGVFSSDAMTPRHKMNREIIGMTDDDNRPIVGVVSEPSLIRSQVLTSDGTAVNDRIDLAGKSLGDNAVKVIAGIIDEIPCVRHLNLRDNRLSDETIKKVVEELTNPDRNMELCSLDLSYNDIDGETAQELANFLMSKHCVLKELRLAKSDLDDSEIAKFSESLKRNKTLTTLDFSNNIIGGVNELLHKTAPTRDKVTGKIINIGGGALADALERNKTLTKLDLSWNQIGVKSAKLLGGMLGSNYTLKWLSLGYNSLQDSGVQEIFNNLIDNTTLTYLDVSSNSIGPAAACVLGNMLRQNKMILDINLEGNPIQELGMRSIIRALKFSIPGRILNVGGCSFEKMQRPSPYEARRTAGHHYCPPPPAEKFDKSTNLSQTNGVTNDTPLFDFSDPVGYYKLDMSVPYNQAIVEEMYFLASHSSGYYFKSIKHDGSVIKLRPPHKTTTKDLLKKRRRASAIIAEGYSRPKSPESQGEESDVDAHYNTNWRYETTSIYTELDLKSWEEEMNRGALLNCANDAPYKIPNYGIMEIVVCYTPMPQAETMLANKTQVDSLLGWCHKEDSTMRLKILELFAADGFLLSHQVQEIIDDFNHSSTRLTDDDTKHLLSHLVPVCIDSGVTENLLDHNLSHVVAGKLINEFNHLFHVLQGSFCGHFSLDLSVKYDRLTLVKIAEQNAYETIRLRDLTAWPTKNGGTSQNGDWSQFRNATYKKPGKLIYNLSEDTTDFFSYRLMDKEDGLVEFDFVSTERIAGHTRAVTTEEFEIMCRTCDLYVSPHLENENIERLAKTVEFVQKNAKREISVHKDDGGRISRSYKSPTCSEDGKEQETPSKRNRRGCLPMSRDNSPTPPVKTPNPTRGAKMQQKSPKAKSPTANGWDEGDGKKKFVTAIKEVTRQNRNERILMTGNDHNFSKKYMLNWLSDKSPAVDDWSEEDKEILFKQISGNFCECTATVPPTITYHVLKIRFVSKKKLNALEFISPMNGMDNPGVWLTKFVSVSNGKFDENLQKAAVAWAHELFVDYKLNEKKGKTKGKRHKSAPITATLRRSKQEGSSPFPPYEFEGTNCICTVHYYDVAVEGLPEGKSQTNFQTILKPCIGAAEAGRIQGQNTFSGMNGLVYWHWQDLRMVQDVTMSFNGDLDRVKRVKGKIGTKVITCRQAKMLAEMINLDAGEYKYNRGDYVSVSHWHTRKQSVFERLARVESVEDDGSLIVIYEDDKSKGKDVKPWIVKEADKSGEKKKHHLREDIVVACFSRVKDLENFNEVMDTLPTKGKLNVTKRLGWLNVLNFEKPDGIFDLNCALHEDRLVLNMLHKLCVVEGYNDKEGRYNHKTTICPGVNVCKSHKGCTCHWFTDERHFLGVKIQSGKHIKVPQAGWEVNKPIWDDPKIEPDITKYSPNWKAIRQKEKERAIPKEGRLSTRFITMKHKNAELRRDLNQMYCLVGVPIIDRHPDKIRRELSYKSQKFDI